MRTEIKKLWHAVNALWNKEHSVAANKGSKRDQLAAWRQFASVHFSEYPFMCKFLHIMVATPANTSPLEHSYTRLQLVDMCNKVMLQKCNSYCLRKSPVKTKDGDKVDWVCRFGYGDFNNETKKSSGREIHLFSSFYQK